MMGTQLLLFASPPPATPAKEQSPPKPVELHAQQAPAALEATIASGEKGKARDIIAAIRTLQQVEHDQRPATPEERQLLIRFSGFGPVALSIFPNPVTGRYKDASWQALGEELRSLLTDEEYASAKRTTPNAFYTSSTVIKAMYQALARLGVPNTGLVLEPGCGPGRFLYLAPKDMRFIGVEMDSISGRIAKALHPKANIRIENFRDTRLPEIDAAIGNVPFDDLKLEHKSQKFSLHDYFIAKSVDALRPGGVLAVVTSHYTLDKQNAAIREYLAERADFVGTIRLPSNAFTREGTHVVTDILFLRKRTPGEPAHHADPAWLETAPLDIEGTVVSINRYFHNHPLCAVPHNGWTQQKSKHRRGNCAASQASAPWCRSLE
ncbi:MAG TPA: N-6 DNA methylase [Terriglobales bacterium]|nr:N-6 DNA methylase [Terriglobales bacterium]